MRVPFSNIAVDRARFPPGLHSRALMTRIILDKRCERSTVTALGESIVQDLYMRSTAAADQNPTGLVRVVAGRGYIV